MLKKVRFFHKWLMALVGIQLLIWSLTGLYMVSTDIHFIHGEELSEVPPATIQTVEIKYELSDLLNTYPLATNVTLQQRLGLPVYKFKLENDWLLINAQTGTTLKPISQIEAESIAQGYLSAELNMKSTQLIDKHAPFELSPRHLPSWQINFEHWSEPTIYVHQLTGEVVTKRHNFWRFFDWMWRLHIMDYDDGENINNPLLTSFAVFTLIATLLGSILSYVWIKTRVIRKLP